MPLQSPVNLSECRRVFLSHSRRRGLFPDAMHGFLELSDVDTANALLFLRRDDCGNVAVLATD
jgi:hypothetical protein